MNRLEFVAGYFHESLDYRKENFGSYLEALVDVSLIPFTLNREEVEISEEGIRWKEFFLSSYFLNLPVYDYHSALNFVLRECKKLKDNKFMRFVMAIKGVSRKFISDNEVDVKGEGKRLRKLLYLLDFTGPNSYEQKGYLTNENLDELIESTKNCNSVVDSEQIKENIVEAVALLGRWETSVRHFPEGTPASDLCCAFQEDSFPFYKYCYLKNIPVPKNNYEDTISQYLGVRVGFHPEIYPTFFPTDAYFRVLECMYEKNRKPREEIKKMVEACLEVCENDEITDYYLKWISNSFPRMLVKKGRW